MKTTMSIKRPWPVTLVCSLSAAAGLALIVYAFTGADAKYQLFYPAGKVLCLIIMFAGLSGVWNMEKWGLWVFSSAVAVLFGLKWWVHAFHFSDLVWLIAVLILLYYARKMK